LLPISCMHKQTGLNLEMKYKTPSFSSEFQLFTFQLAQRLKYGDLGLRWLENKSQGRDLINKSAMEDFVISVRTSWVAFHPI